MASKQTEGTWPYVDIVVLKDYKQGKTGAKPAHTLRIHMDIPLAADELDTIDGCLTKRDNEGVLKAIQSSGTFPAGSIGAATLMAALGLLKDPGLLPAPKTKAGKTLRPSA